MPIDWRRRERVERFHHGGPIRYVSLSPVAGVVLVVAMMVSLSLPAKIHVLAFDLFGDEFHGDYVEPPTLITLSADAQDRIFWDGQPIGQRELAELLRSTMAQPVEPFLVFSPHDSASYGAIANLLNTLKTSGLRQFCVAGLYRNRRFELAVTEAEVGAEVAAIEDCFLWQAGPPSAMFN